MRLAGHRPGGSAPRPDRRAADAEREEAAGSGRCPPRTPPGRRPPQQGELSARSNGGRRGVARGLGVAEWGARRSLHRALPRANLAEAILTVNRAVLPRPKWHLGFGSTLRADRVEHLSRKSRAAFACPFPGIPAVSAPQRFVREPFLCVEFLLARGERELLPAVEAVQGLVHERHLGFPQAPSGPRVRPSVPYRPYS
jgi:hypothetical protein